MEWCYVWWPWLTSEGVARVFVSIYRELLVVTPLWFVAHIICYLRELLRSERTYFTYVLHFRWRTVQWNRKSILRPVQNHTVCIQHLMLIFRRYHTVYALQIILYRCMHTCQPFIRREYFKRIFELRTVCSLSSMIQQAEKILIIKLFAACQWE